MTLGTNRLRSQAVSLKYVHSYHRDYVAIRKILAQTSAPRPRLPKGEVAAVAYGSRMRTSRRSFGKRRIRLSSQARKQLRKLLQRIGLTNCKCIIPNVKPVAGGQRMRSKVIPIFELHCPKVRGAEASYLESRTDAADFRITVALLGTGTDSVSTYEEKTSDGITVKDGACCRIVREARFMITKVRYVCKKCKSTTASRLLFDLAPGGDELIPLALSPSEDGCNKAPSQLKPDECKIIRLPNKVTKKRTITVTKGMKTQSTFGLTFASVNLQGTLGIESLRDINQECVLPGPRTYYHYPVKGVTRFWTASKYRESHT